MMTFENLLIIFLSLERCFSHDYSSLWFNIGSTEEPTSRSSIRTLRSFRLLCFAYYRAHIVDITMYCYPITQSDVTPLSIHSSFGRNPPVQRHRITHNNSKEKSSASYEKSNGHLRRTTYHNRECIKIRRSRQVNDRIVQLWFFCHELSPQRT